MRRLLPLWSCAVRGCHILSLRCRPSYPPLTPRRRKPAKKKKKQHPSRRSSSRLPADQSGRVPRNPAAPEGHSRRHAGLDVASHWHRCPRRRGYEPDTSRRGSPGQPIIWRACAAQSRASGLPCADQNDHRRAQRLHSACIHYATGMRSPPQLPGSPAPRCDRDPGTCLILR
jgi:hypothetical protein